MAEPVIPVETEKLKEEILETLCACFRCRFCLPDCPLFEITGGWVNQGASGIAQALYYGLKWNLIRENRESYKDLLYSCTTCKKCMEVCKSMSVGVDLLKAIKKGRQFLIEEMLGPMPEQKRALESLLNYGNPYGHNPDTRNEWTEGLNIPAFSKTVKFDVLLYIGCTAAYESRVKNVSRSLAQILQKASVDFGILTDEICCGSPADNIGEEALFEEIINNNLEKLLSTGAKQVITISPHCYDAFLNQYPKELGSKMPIKHYTQFISELIDQGKISFSKNIKKRVTFQDPCYLGRHNNIYDIPRKILNSIPGLTLVEMKRNKADALCCGGGGGRMWADFKAEKARLGDIRAREAKETGAEIIVTACPYCLINIEDGLKNTGLDSDLVTMDLAELVLEAI